MSEKKDNIWVKIQKIPNPVILAVFTIFMVIPVLAPLNLPIGVPVMTQQFYDYLLNMPEGSKIVFMSQLSGFNYGDLAPLCAATLRLVTNSPNHLKVIMVFQSADCVPFWDIMKKTYNWQLPPDRKYGVDYVEFGFYIGAEMGWATTCDNFKAMFPNDRFGTPIEDLPIMEGIVTAADWDLMLFPNSWSGLMDYIIRHAYGRYGVKVMLMPAGMCAMSAAAYYPHVSPGFPIGAGGGAQLEKLQGYKSWGTTMADAFSLMSILTVGLACLQIVGDYMVRRSQK
jgi:hypothetical protein